MKAVEITYRYAEGEGPELARPADAAAARDRLDKGNRMFASLLDDLSSGTDVVRRVVHVDGRDFGFLATGQAPRQRPFAAVLGCSDARVPVELIFNTGSNDLFVTRVAGNSLGADVLGSLKYALEHLAESLKVIAVVGHSGCGAISAAVDVFLDPIGYQALATRHSLRAIVDRLLVVVHASSRKLAEVYGADVTRRAGYRKALIEMAVFGNAALGAYALQQEVGAETAAVRAVYGVYVLGTHRIWAPRDDAAAEWTGLAEPPDSVAQIGQLGSLAANSPRIRSLLDAA